VIVNGQSVENVDFITDIGPETVEGRSGRMA
jgi:hypothetical protein